MTSRNFYQGNSIFQSLGNLFPQTKVSDAAQTSPKTGIVSTVEGYLTKTVFGIPVWILLAVVTVVLVLVFVVM